MAGSIKGIIVEIGGDTSGLQKALSKVNSVSSSLSKELRGINSLLKLDPKNAELLRQKQDVLNASISTTQDKLKQLQNIKDEADKKMSEGTEINEENYRNLQREIIKTQNKLSDLKNEASNWNKAGSFLTDLGKELQDVGSKIDNLGTKLTTRLSVPIAGALTIATKEAIEFESAFTGVTKTVDASEEQLGELKQGIKDLAKEIPSTTTEISAVAESAGQLGIQTDNILGFSKAMIDLGNSTNLTSEEAASQLAKFANIMQMSQKDFDKLGSSIVDLGNNFATTEADIVNMAMRLAGAGKQVGLSEGEVLGLATALSSVGIEAEMGGSAISKAMVKMQNAVEQGGTKLDAVLKKTGMTLRELELMSANDSMGFKELSQSIGMTSTEVKQLITAGTNLEDFASVSGMTAEEFKKAWKDDAAGALSAFIKGLGNAQDKGESAITMLSEMGLTEVRLRDSLLRAANAGDLFNNAINTGTKAWKENTALTNEANKRYATTESQLKIARNKIKDIAISLGDKLLPTVNKLLEKAEKGIEKLDKLSDSEKENIIKIGMIVAAIGPLLKIGGTVITTIGKVTKGIGTLTETIGLLKNGIGSATGTSANLAKTIKNLASPAGVTTGVIAGLAAGIAILKYKIDKEYESTAKLNEQLKENNEIRQNSLDAINEQLNANVSEINNTESLRKELALLVNENGEIKEGYEARVKFILNELNNALGTEYKATGDIIENYEKLKTSIDELIQKKKAQIILESQEEKYKEAINNKDSLYKDYIKSIDELNEKQERFNQLKEESKRGFVGSDQSLAKNSLEMKKLSEEITNLTNNLSTQENQLNEYSLAINSYQENSELMLKGGAENYKKIEESISITQSNITKNTKVALSERLKAQMLANEQSRKEYALEVKYNEDAKNSIYATNVQKGQENLKALAEELVERTSTVNELGKDEIEAWRILANKSYSIYYDKISQMPPELSEKIQEMTGITAERTPELIEETENMMKKVLAEIEQNKEFKSEAIKNLKGFLAGLSDGELRELLKQSGTENIDEVIKGIKKGNLAEDEGQKILESLNKGLSNKTWQDTLWTKARGIASTLSSLLTVNANVNGKISNLPGHKNGLDYVPYDDYIARLHKGERVLTAKENKQLMQIEKASKLKIPNIKSIGQSISNTMQPVFTSPTINIYAQDELTPAKMNSIIDTVNRRLGSRY